jgi:glycopeptide antibiotics resistance protein
VPTPRSRLVVAAFVVYLVLLAWIILWKLEVPWVGAAAGLPRPIKLVPIVPSGDAGGSKPLEVVANVLLFVPLGLYLGLLTRWRWWAVLAAAAGFSLALEVTQHLISVGSFDSTDVIVNTIGGALGFVIVRRLALPWPRILLIGGVVAVLAVVAFIASPLHYGPQQDVVVQPRATMEQ